MVVASRCDDTQPLHAVSRIFMHHIHASIYHPHVGWTFAVEGVSILVLSEAGGHEMLWPGVAGTLKSPACNHEYLSGNPLFLKKAAAYFAREQQ